LILLDKHRYSARSDDRSQGKHTDATVF